jgi:hypothetical protein
MSLPPITVLWRGADPFSTELLQVVRTDDRETRMIGTVLVALAEGVAEVRYVLDLDERWRSRRLHVEISGPRTAAMTATGDGNGTWSIDGDDASDLAGCIDVDLGVSPSTNTLPIRRLAPAVGETVSTRVAWVRFPDLTVQPDEQTYQRVGQGTWIFRSEDFESTLEVDGDGLVVRYGDLWDRVASS